MKKGPWTPEEDQKLLAYIKEHGWGSWRSLPSKAGLERCGKSCRLRWTNYLRPDIKRGKFDPQEEKSIIQLHALLGNRTKDNRYQCITSSSWFLFLNKVHLKSLQKTGHEQRKENCSPISAKY